MKDYLGFENARNKKHAELYERLLKRALGREDLAVLVGHHITYELDVDGDGKLDLCSMQEIPSADTLMFDHEFMGKLFGDHALMVMLTLSQIPAERRDDLLKSYLDAVLDKGEQVLEGV